MRVEAADYHALAAVEPDVAKQIGKLAAHRMGGSHGLSGIAAEPPPPRVIVVGHRLGCVPHWGCSCRRVRCRQS